MAKSSIDLLPYIGLGVIGVAFFAVLIFGIPSGLLKKNVEIARSPITGEVLMCPNAPALEMSRKEYNVYVKGTVDPTKEKVLAPTDIIITEDRLDKDKFAILSIDSQIRGRLYLFLNEPSTDVGYEGRIWFYQAPEWRLAFLNIPSNWNCEAFTTAEGLANPIGGKFHYRSRGAQYQLQVEWFDVDNKKTVDTYKETVYVPFRD